MVLGHKFGITESEHMYVGMYVVPKEFLFLISDKNVYIYIFIYYLVKISLDNVWL